MDFATTLNTVRLVFIIADALILVFVVYAITKVYEVRHPIAPRPAAPPVLAAQRVFVQAEWEKIERTFAAGSFDSMKVALIGADKLIDTLLKDAGFTGDTMNERLKQIPQARLASLSRLFRAHRIRNSLVHDLGFTLTADRARETLEDYRAFLAEVGYLAA